MLQFWAKLLEFLCLLHTHLHQLKPAFQPEKDVPETMMFHRMLEGGSRCIIISLPILKKKKILTIKMIMTLKLERIKYIFSFVFLFLPKRICNIRSLNRRTPYDFGNHREPLQPPPPPQVMGPLKFLTYIKVKSTYSTCTFPG